MKIFLAVVISIFSVQVFSFTLVSTTPSMKGWDTKNLIFHLNPTNCRSDIRDLVKDAMNLWNSVPFSNLILELGADTATTPAQAIVANFTEDIVIVCDPAFSTNSPSADPNFVSGYANVALGSNSQIIKGYLILNAQAGTLANLNSLTVVESKIIVAHEMGHDLGLGHSSVPGALMYYSVGYKTEFSLSEDDENGIAYLYGRKELEGKDALLGGCAQVGHQPPGAGPTSMIALLFLIPMLLAQYLKKNPHSRFRRVRI